MPSNSKFLKFLLTLGGRTNTGLFHSEYNEESELEVSTSSPVKTEMEKITHEYKWLQLNVVHFVRCVLCPMCYHDNMIYYVWKGTSVVRP